MNSGAHPPNQFPLVCRNEAPPDPALTAMGLTDLSEASGVPADSLMAVLATVLIGLAGPDASIKDSIGPCRLEKLDLLTPDEDFRLQKLINRLVLPLEAIQRRLVGSMSQISPTALELTAKGAYSNSTTIKLADQDLREKSLRRHLDVLTVPTKFGASSALIQDLADDPVPPRVEAILHPQFLVKGVDEQSLSSLVEKCHLRTALVVQPKLELAKKGPAPSKALKILTSLLVGMTVTKRPDSIERGRDASLLAKVHVLLTLAKPDIEAMHRWDGDCLDRFLWLKIRDGHGSKPGNENSCEAFFDVYQATIEEILRLRREGRELMMGFETREMAAKFCSELHDYENELKDDAASPKPWVRGLPQTLFWALGFLRRSMPIDCRPDEKSLMTASFAVARRLVKDHREQVLVITNASLLEFRHRLARIIVKKMLEANAPQTFRDISRYTRHQKSDVVEPVVHALLEVGVLVKDPDGHHTLSPVRLSDVEEQLDRRFSQA